MKQISIDDVLREWNTEKFKKEVDSITSKSIVKFSVKFDNKEIQLINGHIKSWTEYQMKQSCNNRHFIDESWKQGKCIYRNNGATPCVEFFYPVDDEDDWRTHGYLAMMVWIPLLEDNPPFHWMNPDIEYETEELLKRVKTN